MPALRPHRHELAAQARVVGIARGETQAQSYLRAGYKATRSAHACASRLLNSAKLTDRIAELQRRAAERSLTTVEKLTNELDEARRLAFERGQAHAGVAATVAKAKLHGLMINRTERAVEPPAKTLDEVVDSIVKEAGSNDAALQLIEALRTMILARIQR